MAKSNYMLKKLNSRVISYAVIVLSLVRIILHSRSSLAEMS